MNHLSIFMPYIEKFIELLKEKYGDRLISICLFGSIARGDFNSNSDIDVLIIIKGFSSDLDSRISELFEIKRKLRRSIEYKNLLKNNMPRMISEIVFTPDEVSRHPPILLDIIIDGVIVYDKNDFLRKELEKLKVKLNSIGAKRIKSKHGWYWILKPNIKFGEVIKI